MTAKTLEEEAREAAEAIAGDTYTRGSIYWSRCVTDCSRAYLAAATLREKELSELKAQQKASDDLAFATVAEYKRELLEARVETCNREREIATLRARVAELEERAAQWVPESGLKPLMDQGWTEFCNDKRGNEPRLWLMVPPIPLPEGKS